jgi:hypothetical protein
LYRDSDGGLTDRTKQISFPARITKWVGFFRQLPYVFHRPKTYK